LSGERILIVEDERAIREMVGLALGQAGYRCLEAGNAHEAEAVLRAEPPDLVLLDWMLPGLSGVDFARRLRRQPATRDLPVIMLTARADEDDLIQGLEAGADDYITKPFSVRELLARIQALLRRRGGPDTGSVLEAGGLRLDPVAHRITLDGESLDLGPTEFRLLKFFMQHPERVFSREQVLDHVWGDNVFIEERTVDVHIRRLRKALAPAGYDTLIQTVRGTGYRFSRRP